MSDVRHLTPDEAEDPVDQLSIRQLQEPGTFALVGELDMLSAEAVVSNLKVAPEDRDLVLELSELRFMDSSGIRAILQVAGDRNNGSRVVLRNATPAVERVLDIALPGDIPGVLVASRNEAARG